MKRTKRSIKDTIKVKRLSFPDDEKVHPWLPISLDAYYIVDKGVAVAIESEQKRNRKLACSNGCSNCCRTHRDIPVYPLELVGISWYATEKMSGFERGVLLKQLEKHKDNDPCPFLIKESCSVHLMRPIACRQFNVFGKSCAEGEDPYYTRREDVLPPVKKCVDQAFFIMLPFYGVVKESERIKVVESGAMHRLVRLMHDCRWKSLSERMLDFDEKKARKENKGQI